MSVVGRRSRDVADCVYFYIRKIGPRKKGVRITQEPMKISFLLCAVLSLVLYFSLTCYHDNSYGHFHLFYDNRGELLWDKRFFATINSTWRSSFHPTTIYYLPLEVEKGRKSGKKDRWTEKPVPQTCTVIWGICQLLLLWCGCIR